MIIQSHVVQIDGSVQEYGLYGLFRPRCPMFPERLLNLITHSLGAGMIVNAFSVFHWDFVILMKEIVSF